MPALGSLPRTVPSLTVSEYFPIEWPNDRWVFSSASWAWSSVIPFVRGTSYRSLPSDSTTVTVPPSRTREPVPGSVPMTRPG